MKILDILDDSIQNDNGEYSCMRINNHFVCFAVTITWIVFCFIEARFVPITWEMVALVGCSQGAKALQYKYEKKRENI